MSFCRLGNNLNCSQPVNKLSELNKRVNREAAAHRCSVAVSTPVLEPLFNKVAGLQLSCEYYEIFKNSFFHKTPPVAASEKFINSPGKH